VRFADSGGVVGAQPASNLDTHDLGGTSAANDHDTRGRFDKGNQGRVTGDLSGIISSDDAVGSGRGGPRGRAALSSGALYWATTPARSMTASP
jgi:hypothetical protein